MFNVINYCLSASQELHSIATNKNGEPHRLENNKETNSLVNSTESVSLVCDFEKEGPSMLAVKRKRDSQRSIPAKPLLRERKMHVNQELKSKTRKMADKPLTVVVQRPKCMPSPCKSVELNEILLFKLSGFCEWPCFVTRIESGMIHIEFFGDHTIQKSKIGTKFFKFQESYELILFNLRKRKTQLYQKSVREAEIALGIDEHISILNRI